MKPDTSEDTWRARRAAEQAAAVASAFARARGEPAGSMKTGRKSTPPKTVK